MTQPLISLCMIVGNEENCIFRCLESFKPVADEIILVRAIGNLTPDKTIEIGRDCFGAIVDEYNNSKDHDWPHVDDFAAARNRSFSLARGKFVLWCDADDVLLPGMSEKIRALAEADKSDWFNFLYDVQNAKLTPMRERMFRKGWGHWRNAVHENCDPKKDARCENYPDIIIQHRPEFQFKASSKERNLRILGAQTAAAHIYAFYTHQEYFLTGGRDEAWKWGKIALALPDLGVVERYEVLLDMAELESGSINDKAKWAVEALSLQPDRREALAILSMLMMDAQKPICALSWARMMMGTPKPNAFYWTQKGEWYGWKAVRIYSQALRMAGFTDPATKQEDLLHDAGGKKISILHATKGRAQQAINNYWHWLNLCEKPERVEYIFAVDEGDEVTLASVKGLRHVVVPSGGGSVAAWNAAAKASRGEILIQMSDDWTTFPGWDSAILDRMGANDSEKVLAISDGRRKDDLLCMAILNRKRYEAQGNLFFEGYKSVYSDNEFTHRAFKDGVVVDGKEIVFTHHNPYFETGKFDADAIYLESNSDERYKEGEELFLERNPDAK